MSKNTALARLIACTSPPDAAMPVRADAVEGEWSVHPIDSYDCTKPCPYLPSSVSGLRAWSSEQIRSEGALDLLLYFVFAERLVPPLG